VSDYPLHRPCDFCGSQNCDGVCVERHLVTGPCAQCGQPTDPGESLCAQCIADEALVKVPVSEVASPPLGAGTGQGGAIGAASPLAHNTGGDGG
jgi:hypothetical protein